MSQKTEESNAHTHRVYNIKVLVSVDFHNSIYTHVKQNSAKFQNKSTSTFQGEKPSCINLKNFPRSHWITSHFEVNHICFPAKNTSRCCVFVAAWIFPWSVLFSTWWLQPYWKICSSNWIISPWIGVKINSIWNHHLENQSSIQLRFAYAVVAKNPKKSPDGGENWRFSMVECVETKKTPTNEIQDSRTQTKKSTKSRIILKTPWKWCLEDEFPFGAQPVFRGFCC